MILRDLTLELLRQKRWELFWEPEEDEEWWDKVCARFGSMVCAGWAGERSQGDHTQEKPA